MYSINGKPLLDYLVNNLICNYNGNIYIATSDQSSDDEIERYCNKLGVPCFRGQLEDVANRMLSAAHYFHLSEFVRINGDSPLIDPKIIALAADIYLGGDFDLVTNTYPRSFPIGQSVEVIRTSTLENVYQKMSNIDEFEHVTRYYYNHSNELKIKNFQNQEDLSSYRLVVDTPEDLNRLKKILGSLTKPHTDYTLDELIELYPRK